MNRSGEALAGNLRAKALLAKPPINCGSQLNQREGALASPQDLAARRHKECKRQRPAPCRVQLLDECRDRPCELAVLRVSVRAAQDVDHDVGLLRFINAECHRLEAHSAVLTIERDNVRKLRHARATR